MQVQRHGVGVIQGAGRADEIIVVDAGRVVQRGSHTELLSVPGPYARMHASWAAQHSR